MHCHLHRGDWNFHLTNEKKKKTRVGNAPQTICYMLSKIPQLCVVHCFCDAAEGFNRDENGIVQNSGEYAGQQALFLHTR